MACPDVQPPAYLEPNPTMNPPKAKRKNPFTVKADSKLNNSRGCSPSGAENPKTCKSEMVSFEMSTGS